MGMITRENFYRPPEVYREPYQVPAGIYNVGRVLLIRADHGRVYVPMVDMGYLAVLQEDEWLFVERLAGHTIEAAWQDFRPQRRTGLQAPVTCRSVLYVQKSPHFMRQLQWEFLGALQAVAANAAARHTAQVVLLHA